MPVVRKFVCPKCILEGKGQCEFAEELPEEWIGVNGGDVTEEQRKGDYFILSTCAGNHPNSRI